MNWLNKGIAIGVLTVVTTQTFIATVTHAAADHTATVAPAHDNTHVDSMPTMLPGELAHIGLGPNIDTASFPEYVTNCWGAIRSSRTSAVGNCYNYSGSGSLKYQIAALGIDACGRRMWFYGSVGQVYYPGKTTFGRNSVVYSPGLTWRFYAWKIIVWKP